MSFSAFVETMVNAVTPMVSDGSVILRPPPISSIKVDGEALDLVLDTDAPVGSTSVTVRNRVGDLVRGVVPEGHLILLGDESRRVASWAMVERGILEVSLSSPLTVEALAGDPVSFENGEFHVEHSATVSIESFPMLGAVVDDSPAFSFQMSRQVVPSADWTVERRTAAGDMLRGVVSYVDVSGPVVLVLVGKRVQRR